MNEARELLRRAARTRAAERRACPSEETILSFYRGRLDAAGEAAMREHLAVCASCRGLAADAREFLRAMGEPAAPLVEPASRRRRAWALAAGLILAVGVAGWSWWTREPRSPWRDFAAAAAAYPLEAGVEDEIVWRGESADDLRAAAMEPYRAGDYAAAERQLKDFLREHPQDAQAELYRGVSLLLLRRPGQAVAPLVDATAHGDEAVAREARWYLSLARLEIGARETASEDLRLLAATAGRRQDAARELLRRLEAR